MNIPCSLALAIGQCKAVNDQISMALYRQGEVKW